MHGHCSTTPLFEVDRIEVRCGVQAYESRSMRGMYRLKAEGGMGAPPTKVQHLDYDKGADGMDTADIQKPMNGTKGQNGAHV